MVNCKTNGHLFMSARRCIFCGEPAEPVEPKTMNAAATRIAELEACVLEYWHAKDWAAVGAADATAAKLLPADMLRRIRKK